MYDFDAIKLCLMPSREGLTKIRLTATVYLCTESAEARRYLERLSDAHMCEPLCIALPADAPWPWLSQWGEHLAAAEIRHEIRFVFPAGEDGVEP